MKGFNVVCLAGNLTRDPEMKHTPGGTSLVELRLAVNERARNEQGEWVDKPNYFNVTVWGRSDGQPGQAEAVANNLGRGSPVLIRGQLKWREWQDSETGAKRQAVDVVAREVIFLGSKRDADGESGGDFAPAGERPGASAARDEPDFVPSAPTDDDIPF